MITRIDSKAIQARLSPPESVLDREAEVTPEMIELVAVAMAKRGYRHDAVSLEAIRLYLAGYGLMLYGPVGTGKTAFFRALRTLDAKPIEVFSMHGILGRTEADIREMMDSFDAKELVLDDIGAEPQFNNYGVKFDILAYMIDRRLQSRERTHFTTNLTKREIEARYGRRVIDRMSEMVRSVEFAGKSKRRPRPNPRAVAIIDEYHKRNTTHT